MDAQVYFHGVPNGQKIYGEEKEIVIDYLSLFYGANNGEEYDLIVETKRIDNKKYCFYNLINYKDVIAYDGRAGSYVGVTLRIDKFCKNIKKVYSLLYWVMKFRLVEICLKEEGNKTLFTVSSFEQKKEELEHLTSEIYDGLNQCLKGEELLPLPEKLNVGKGSACNINEYTNEILANAVLNNGKLSTSPFRPTKRESDVIKKSKEDIASIRESAKKEKESIEADLHRQKQRCSSLEQENSELQAKKQELESKLAELKIQKDVFDIVGQIKEPIQKLAVKFDSLLLKAKKSDTDFMRSTLKKRIPIPPIKVILLLLNLLLTLFLCAKLLMMP